MSAGKLTYNYLSKNCGLKVSSICLGTMTFGESKGGGRPGQCDEALAHQILDRYVAWGGNFIDTANMYQEGQSETMIGTWLKKREDRDKLIIATKVRVSMDSSDPNCEGLSRKHIIWSVEESLRRLQTDYIDLYQIHAWDEGTPIKETFSALNDLVKSGKIRYVGVSNVTGWQLQKILDLQDRMGWEACVTVQNQYNLLCRETELEVVEVCKNEGLGMLPWSPLKGGWLSGKFKRDTAASGDTRVGWVSEKESSRRAQSHPSFQQYQDNEKVWNLIDKVESIGKAHEKSVAQVSLKWLLQKPTVTSVIIGAKNLQQLDDNLGAGTDWKLTDSEMSELDDLSQYPIPYPYEMVNRLNVARKH
ncbi:unnamed protein product [Owenia fusiformis]|uniref:Uncharacterized protein n=1 Tax=Owenia fusiformis TaxID=6347 RepID=A0A8J1TUV0_OWEFU|nr:unnamed protein product [Owenia fusiformis]